MNVKSFLDDNKFVINIANETIDNIKATTFDDNGNLVIVLESVKGETNSSPLSQIVSTENASPSDAKPICTVESSPENAKSDKVVLSDGKYAGENPWKLLDDEDPKKAEAAFVYLAESIRSKNITNVTVANEVKLALNSYLYARFCECDAYEYAGKLNEKQAAIFFKRFDAAISSKIKKAICNQYGVKEWNDFLIEASVDVKRSAIAEIINKFKSLKL